MDRINKNGNGRKVPTLDEGGMYDDQIDRVMSLQRLRWNDNEK